MHFFLKLAHCWSYGAHGDGRDWLGSDSLEAYEHLSYANLSVERTYSVTLRVVRAATRRHVGCVGVKQGKRNSVPHFDGGVMIALSSCTTHCNTYTSPITQTLLFLLCQPRTHDQPLPLQ